MFSNVYFQRTIRAAQVLLDIRDWNSPASKEVKDISGHPVPAEGTWMQLKCSAYILSALVNPIGTEEEVHGFSEQ